MGKHKVLIIFLVILAIIILSPILYLAYDRMIMPPPPTWTSPPFTPDSIKAPWIRNEDGGAGYYLDFVAKHKDNNAFANYLNAFSLFTVSSRDEGALSVQLEIIANNGWTQDYPLVEETLKLNQQTLDEIHQGVLIKHSELPPTPYDFSEAPLFNFRVPRTIAYLQVSKGLKLEKQNKPEQALQYYLDGLELGKSLCQKDQASITHMIGLAVVARLNHQIQLLQNSFDLTEKDYQRILDITLDVDTGISTFIDMLQIEHRQMYKGIKDTYISTKNLYFNAKGMVDLNTTSYSQFKVLYLFLDLYFNKGHIFRDKDRFDDYVLDTLSTKHYQEIMNINWQDKIPTDIINRTLVMNFVKAYHQQVLQQSILRLTELQSAIHLYHLQKKQWPKTLDDLKEYLSPIPKDPFTDQSFLWGQENGKPFAYSPGPDNKDDKAQITYDPTNGTLSSGDIRP